MTKNQSILPQKNVAWRRGITACLIVAVIITPIIIYKAMALRRGDALYVSDNGITVVENGTTSTVGEPATTSVADDTEGLNGIVRQFSLVGAGALLLAFGMYLRRMLQQ